MTQKKTGGPAFPPTHDPNTHESGMTLRDWFAGQALANPRTFPQDWSATADIAEWAYGLADDMIAERDVK